MDEAIRIIAGKLGLPESAVRSASVAVLRFAREKVGAAEFDAVVAKVPGAAEFLAATAADAPAAPSGGGLLGGLLGSAGGLFGGDTADFMGLVGKLEAAGVPAGKAMPFAQALFAEIERVGGPEIVQKIVERVPAAAAFVTPKPNP